MKFIQILFSLATLSFFGATATPTSESRTNRPPFLSREAIPAGVPVFGLDHNNMTDDFSEIAKRDSICGGSALCLFNLPKSTTHCKAASDAYIDGAFYCGYTSRVSNHCTAMFYCEGQTGSCLPGWYIKES